LQYYEYETLAGSNICADIKTEWEKSSKSKKNPGKIVEGDLKRAVLLFTTYDIEYKNLPKQFNKSLKGYRKLLTTGITHPWGMLPHLRNKFYTLTTDGSGADFYTFRTRLACDAYITSKLWSTKERIPFYENNEYRIVQVLESSAHTVDLGEWP